MTYAMTAGITKAGTGIDGISFNILGQTYVPKQLSDNSFSWHATFPPGTFVPPHIHPPIAHVPWAIREAFISVPEIIVYSICFILSCEMRTQISSSRSRLRFLLV